MLLTAIGIGCLLIAVYFWNDSEPPPPALPVGE